MFSLHNIDKKIILKSIHAIYYSELPRNHVFIGEKHDFWELIYIDRGKVFGTIDSNEFELKRDEFMLIKPNSFHDLRTNHTNASNILNLSFECTSEFLVPISNSCESLSMFQLEILKMILDILEIKRENLFEVNLLDDILVSNQVSFRDQMIANMIELFLIDFINKDAPKQNKYFLFHGKQLSSEAKLIFEAIENNLNEQISLESISYITGMSKEKIRNLVKKSFSMTLKELVNSIKINKAKVLLRESDLNISEISKILGYSTIGYFSDTFHKFAGIRPQDYSRSVKK